MPASKAKRLASIFRLAHKTLSQHNDVCVKDCFRSPSRTLTTCSTKVPKQPSAHYSKPLSHFTAARFNLHNSTDHDSDEATKQLSKEIAAILSGSADIYSFDSELSDEEEEEVCMDVPWFSTMFHSNISLRRKEMSRERKQKWVFKGSQTNRFQRLVNMCGQKLGSDTALQVFGRLGRERGVKEYNALMRLCIDRARNAEDEEEALQQIFKAYKLFKEMGEEGFPIDEGTYGPFLMYLIDMGMVEEFYFFCNVIREKKSNPVSRLSYYEMLLWIGVDNEVKIKELCDNVVTSGDRDKSDLLENYLLALSSSDRKKELLLLLNSIDITKVSSVDRIASIFKSLGRLSLESVAKKLLQALKDHGNFLTYRFKSNNEENQNFSVCLLIK